MHYLIAIHAALVPLLFKQNLYINGSQWLSMALSGSQWLPVFSTVISSSQWLPCSGSQWLSNILKDSQWL